MRNKRTQDRFTHGIYKGPFYKEPTYRNQDNLETRTTKDKVPNEISSNSSLKIREKSVGTTELHYSTKKREYSASILKAFFVRHFRSISNVSYSDECWTKKAFSMLKDCSRAIAIFITTDNGELRSQILMNCVKSL